MCLIINYNKTILWWKQFLNKKTKFNNGYQEVKKELHFLRTVTPILPIIMILHLHITLLKSENINMKINKIQLINLLKINGNQHNLKKHLKHLCIKREWIHLINVIRGSSQEIIQKCRHYHLLMLPVWKMQGKKTKCNSCKVYINKIYDYKIQTTYLVKIMKCQILILIISNHLSTNSFISFQIKLVKVVWYLEEDQMLEIYRKYHNNNKYHFNRILMLLLNPNFKT